MFKSTYQRATQKVKIHAYHVTAIHKLKEPGREKCMAYCWWLQAFLNEHPGILDFVWFADKTWFHLSGYMNSQNTWVWAAENLHVYRVPQGATAPTEGQSLVCNFHMADNRAHFL
jgi:hypothetical protein